MQCEKMYSKRANLKAHMKSAHEKKTFDYQICKKSCTSQHRKDHHYERCKENENVELKHLMEEFVEEIEGLGSRPMNMKFADEYEVFVQTQTRDYPCDDCAIVFFKEEKLADAQV